MAGLDKKASSDHMPTHLFHFLPWEHGVSAIRNKKLKIAQFSTLNDPYEFHGVNTANGMGHGLRKLKDNISKTKGIICFSATWTEPIMWAHYTKNHTGLALRYTIANPDMFYRVEYVQSPYSLDHFDDGNGGFVPDLAVKLISVKHESWSYEREYRIQCLLGETDPVSGLYFQNLGDDIKLDQVTLGLNCIADPEEIWVALDEANQLAEVYKAAVTNMSYQLGRNRLSRKKLA